jgi:predicted CopG family antitoxin
MSSNQKTISVPESVKEDLTTKKRDGESWGIFLTRLLQYAEQPTKERIRKETLQVLREEELIDATENIPVSEEDHNKLVEVVELGKQEWIDKYFDFMGEIIESIGIEEEDERISTTITSNPGKGFSLIGINAYVLKIIPSSRVITSLFPTEIETLEPVPLAKSDVDKRQYKINTEMPNPHHYSWVPEENESVLESHKDDIINAAEQECKRGSRSRNRKHHNPAVYQAATDSQYRDQVFADADFNGGE